MCWSTFGGRSPLDCLKPYPAGLPEKGDVYVNKINTTCKTNEKNV